MSFRRGSALLHIFELNLELKSIIYKIITGSTSSLEQWKHTHLSTLTICDMNPTWKTGLANSRCPKWPGHSIWLPF